MARRGLRCRSWSLELGGGGGRERGSEQKVTVVFGGPVDRAGNPVKIAQPSSERKG